MKKGIGILVCLLCVATASAQAPNKESQLRFQVITLKAKLWDQLTGVYGDDPMGVISRQDTAIRTFVRVVVEHGDQGLIVKLRSAGLNIPTEQISAANADSTQ